MTKIIGEYYTDGIDIYKHLKDARWKRLKPLARDCFDSEDKRCTRKGKFGVKS